MTILGEELARHYEEVTPMEFYRDIFVEGELDSWGDIPSERHKGKYCGIAVRITDRQSANGKPIVKRYTITDELDEIDRLIWCDDFCIVSPISYAGKSRDSKNARIMYALCVELDNLIVEDGKQIGLHCLINQWSDRVHWLPRPTYCVASGSGVHLYYLFDKGLPLFRNVVGLHSYKRKLTEMIWNRHVTLSCDEDTIQQESIFQGFRMVGTITKNGERVQAFKTGDRVTIGYMNSFIPYDYLKRHPECQIVENYKSKLSRGEAKEKYPDWYERRIEKGEHKGRWTCNRAVYDWWLRRIENEAVVGHRYYCLMMLAIYAIKCDISQDELEEDCLRLMEVFEGKTDSEDNHFTIKDVMDALQSYEDGELVTYPVNSISNRSGLHIKKNRRNYRKQKVHVKYMNNQRAFKVELGECTNGGRPTAQNKVAYWRIVNPTGKKADCIRETGLSKKTVYKWWE